ncbi:hypothetical protein JTB14_001405 [Gonioctena quinquepunctata]|nr:hypothetical protein JTB14_001405 [Gonioctena quinquepunctata]
MPQTNQAGQPVLNWNLFKSQVNNLKPYDGDSNTVNKFIYRCDKLYENYIVLNDPIFNDHIFECIQEKLIGKAECMVGNRAELKNWPDLKNALKQCFSDRRDLDCLVLELTRSRPHKGEDLISFGTRLQLIRSSVAQRISNDTNLQADEKVYQISHYEKVALSTFIQVAQVF